MTSRLSLGSVGLIRMRPRFTLQPRHFQQNELRKNIYSTTISLQLSSKNSDSKTESDLKSFVVLRQLLTIAPSTYV